jgi:hypothetical protein
MRSLKIGDVTVTSIIEWDGPWRRPADMFPAYDPDVGQRHLAAMDPEVYDAAFDRMVITYQTFVVRMPHHTILVDTCTGEDNGYPAPMDFPKQPWLGLAIPALRICRETTESAPNAPHSSSSWRSSGLTRGSARRPRPRCQHKEKTWMAGLRRP